MRARIHTFPIFEDMQDLLSAGDILGDCYIDVCIFSKSMEIARGVTQQQSSCLAGARPWVPSPVHQKKKR
jgi:hypothetical protein